MRTDILEYLQNGVYHRCRKRLIAVVLGVCVFLTGCQKTQGSLSDTDRAPVAMHTPIPTTATNTIDSLPDPTVTPMPESASEETVDNEIVSSHYQERQIALSKMDFASYEEELSEEDWQALCAFFPVLVEGEIVMVGLFPREGEVLDAYEQLSLNDTFNSYLSEDFAEFILRSFMLCDITGDGQKELAILSDYGGGFWCVLHREGDIFYCVYMPYRWFEGLQENGIFIGSGGAATNNYYTLHFKDGAFWVELQGEEDWGYYAIHGEEVNQEEFLAWEKEVMVGNVPMHDARGKQ